MTDFHKLRDETETLLTALAAGDVGADVPVYCVLSSEFGVHRPDGRILGMADNGLAATFRSEIGERWKGAGLAVVCNDPAIADWQPGREAAAFQAVALHELAHVLVDRHGVQQPTAVEAAAQREHVVQLLEGDTDGYAPAAASWPDSLRRETPRWTPGQELRDKLDEIAILTAHDARFIRALLHLHHRAEAISGRYVPVLLARGLTNPALYDFALGDEFTEMADKPIRDVLATAMPDEFAALYVADLLAAGVPQPAPPTAPRLYQPADEPFQGVAPITATPSNLNDLVKAAATSGDACRALVERSDVELSIRFLAQ